MTDDALYWLFSTIAQTLGAIVGVIGMLTVYKLQLIANNIRQRMEGSVESRKVYYPDTFFSITPEEFVESWFNLREPDSVQSDHSDSLDIVAALLNRLLANRKEIISGFLYFLIPNLSFIVLSILGLLHCNSLASWGVGIAAFTGIAMFYTFCSTIYLCYSLTKS